MAITGLTIEGANNAPDPLPEGTTLTADGVITKEMQPEEEPTLILGKFKDTEALAQAYTELQKKMGATRPTPPAPKAEDPAPVAEATPTIETPAKTPEELDDEQIAAARAEREMYAKVVGGEESLTKVLDWAQNNLGKEDAEFYNKAVASNDVVAIKTALKAMAASYEKSFPAEPVQPAVVPATKPSTQAKPFATQSDMYDAIANPKYAQDPTYRRGIEARIKASPW